MGIRCFFGWHNNKTVHTIRMLRTRDYNQYGWTSRYVLKKESGKEQTPVTKTQLVCQRCGIKSYFYDEGWDK